MDNMDNLCNLDFYFYWYGNKRKEIKEFIDYIDLDKYDTFIEPFGGSLAFSRYIYNACPKKTFLVCDNDEKLTKFCNEFYKYKRETIENVKKKSLNLTKDEFNDYINKPYSDDTLEFLIQYLFYSKIYGTRKGLYPSKRSPCKFFKFYEKTSKADEFFKNVKYEHLDFKAYLDKYKHDKRAFVFLDPPYPIDSECSYYTDNNALNVWQYLIDFVNTCECSFVMILNSNVFMDVIFKDLIKGRYEKTYATNTTRKDGDKLVKKSATHLIISNVDAPKVTCDKRQRQN